MAQGKVDVRAHASVRPYGRAIAFGIGICLHTAPGLGQPEAAPSPDEAAPAPMAPPAPAALAAAAVASGGNENAIAKSLIAAWLAANPPVDPAAMATVLETYAIFEIRAVDAELASQAQQATDYAQREKLAALVAKLELALQVVKPTRYALGRPALEQKNPCYKDPYPNSCNDRLDGFAAAAHNRDDEKACWRLLNDLKNKGPNFRQGYLDWWHMHADPNDQCEKPPKPPRCLIAGCWGGDSGYRFGVAFRPAVQLGGTWGDGLGFSKEKADFAGQVSGSLGLRVFFFDDLFDIHTGLGIGTSSADAPAPAKGETEIGSKTQAFLLWQIGVAGFNGIAGISYLRTMDPRSGGPNPGNGISLFVDAAAAERIAAKISSD